MATLKIELRIVIRQYYYGILLYGHTPTLSSLDILLFRKSAVPNALWAKQNNFYSKIIIFFTGLRTLRTIELI